MFLDNIFPNERKTYITFNYNKYQIIHLGKYLQFSDDTKDGDVQGVVGARNILKQLMHHSYRLG